MIFCSDAQCVYQREINHIIHFVIQQLFDGYMQVMYMQVRGRYTVYTLNLNKNMNLRESTKV